MFHDVKEAIEKLFKQQHGDEKIQHLVAEIETDLEGEEVEFDYTFNLIMRTWYEYPEPIICPKLPKEEAPKKKEAAPQKGKRGRGRGRNRKKK